MLTTLLIALREFLEVFLIIGVFLGISNKLKIGKEKEIAAAAALGIFLSFALATGEFLIGERAKFILTEKNADLLEGYLMIFSGFFIAYVILSLHKFFALKRTSAILQAHEKLKSHTFDLSLFFMIVFFVLREGFEIALFTATTSLFNKFAENMAGLLGGFFISFAVGLITCLAYVRLPISRIFQLTEYLLIFLGASLVKNGLGELFAAYFHIELSQVVPVRLWFLPAAETYAGHFIKQLFGVERNFSLLSLTMMAGYILCIYLLFYRTKKTPQS
ncbi:FTR1 family protein [Candidatus Roizmanbacteria bacterium]|nr:FTR1 family protein [Candidatus Roizmanbacteria bacterium]